MEAVVDVVVGDAGAGAEGDLPAEVGEEVEPVVEQSRSGTVLLL